MNATIYAVQALIPDLGTPAGRFYVNVRIVRRPDTGEDTVVR